MATRFSPNRNRVGIVVNYSYTVRTKNADIPISEQEELVDVTQLEQRTDEIEVRGESPTHYHLLKKGLSGLHQLHCSYAHSFFNLGLKSEIVNLQ